MKKLILENFTCNQSTESSGDSPYFLVFVGRSANPGNAFVHLVSLSSLDDTVHGTGHFTPVNQVVSKDVNDKSIVIVALVERDDGTDITGEELDNVQSWMRNKFADFSKSSRLPRALLVSLMGTMFTVALANNTTNDDLLGVQHLPIPSSGQPKMFRIRSNSEEGTYDVKFRVA